MRIVSTKAQYLSAMQSMAASLLLGTFLMDTGHMWLRIASCVFLGISKRSTAFSHAMSGKDPVVVAAPNLVKVGQKACLAA